LPYFVPYKKYNEYKLAAYEIYFDGYRLNCFSVKEREEGRGRGI
jgi:hypothetical protein